MRLGRVVINMKDRACDELVATDRVDIVQIHLTKSIRVDLIQSYDFRAIQGGGLIELWSSWSALTTKSIFKSMRCERWEDVGSRTGSPWLVRSRAIPVVKRKETRILRGLGGYPGGRERV